MGGAYTFNHSVKGKADLGTFYPSWETFNFGILTMSNRLVSESRKYVVSSGKIPMLWYFATAKSHKGFLKTHQIIQIVKMKFCVAIPIWTPPLIKYKIKEKAISKIFSLQGVKLMQNVFG